MKEIPLTQGQAALVDDDMFDFLNQWKWWAQWNPGTKSFYAAQHAGSRRFRPTIYMARLIMQTPKGFDCDHINHQTLDNRKSNLRNCTRSQNTMNSHLRSDNTTGSKGVRLHRNKFQARIMVNGKIVFCKDFPTLEEAIAAREEAVRKYHGEFANIE